MRVYIPSDVPVLQRFDSDDQLISVEDTGRVVGCLLRLEVVHLLAESNSENRNVIEHFLFVADRVDPAHAEDTQSLLQGNRQ
jgi:hypothetical protein